MTKNIHFKPFPFSIVCISSPFVCSSMLDVTVKSCNPVVFSFYNYLRTHPLIIRRHFANPEGTAVTVGLTAEMSGADEINLIERKLFFTTANAHFKVGLSVVWQHLQCNLLLLKSGSFL